MPGIKIKVNPDGSRNAKVVGCSDKEIADIKLQDGKFKMIEKIVNDKGETTKVIHRAWGDNFFHEDLKYSIRKIPVIKIDENKKLEERRILREKIKKRLEASEIKNKGEAK